ncbi:hypothetical protein NQ317_009737 [Molorchus minor]|uniref:Uncharacterized protein n=1 Tax=Molorchus minor TaxID=1323400 RepID=A0ABQ9IQX9_9CUCU|nr:hypothetical protein NQ317_009737 [Molorchus minor]
MLRVTPSTSHPNGVHAHTPLHCRECCDCCWPARGVQTPPGRTSPDVTYPTHIHMKYANTFCLMDESPLSHNQINKCQVKRLKRKSVYPDNYPDQEKIKVNSEIFFDKMQKKWQEFRDNCYLVEVLTAFQASLQSVCENLILMDRVESLKEKRCQCFVKKVTNDLISPRCYALVANK